MQDAKTFFDRLKSDEAFAEEFSKKVSATGNTDPKDVHEAVIATAAEYGYEVTQADIDDFVGQYGEELSEDELGKVAGGTLGVLISLFVTSIVTSASLSGAISYYTGENKTV